MEFRVFVHHVIAILIILLLITGCARIQTPPKIIFEDGTHLVRLDLNRSIGEPNDPDRYTHPTEIVAIQLHTILDSLNVQEHRALLQRTFSGPANQIKVFSEHDITALEPRIREAFLRATPREHVTFAVINPTGNTREVTAGEMFVKENTLHLILNCFQVIPTDDSLSALCGPVRRQGYDLSFAAKEHFIGFGNEFFGNGTKEIIVDYASIHSSAAPLAATVLDDAASAMEETLPMTTDIEEPDPTLSAAMDSITSSLDTMATPEIEPQPVAHKDASQDATDHVADSERQYILMLERKIEALTQLIRHQRQTFKRQPSPQEFHPLRVLFLTTPPMRGEDVIALQRALGIPPDRTDGIFGRETDQAVRTFQRQRGIAVDGKVEPTTLHAIGTLP